MTLAEELTAFRELRAELEQKGINAAAVMWAVKEIAGDLQAYEKGEQS